MEADPDELLVWLKGDGGGERDLQISALEQLCKFDRLQTRISFFSNIRLVLVFLIRHARVDVR